MEVEAMISSIQSGHSIHEMQQELQRKLERQVQLKQEVEEAIAELVRIPSNQLPLSVDILISIFSILIFSDPKSIGCLLFVCRDWYSVITSTPVLWSVIEVVGPSDERELPALESYCRACIQRSSSAPLDIQIDYRQLCKYDGSALDKFIRERCRTVQLNAAFSCFLEYQLLRQLHRSRNARYFELCAAPIRALIGQNGREVSRWRSFTFCGAPWNYSRTRDRNIPVLRHALPGESITIPRRHVFDFASLIVWESVNSSQRDKCIDEGEVHDGSSPPNISTPFSDILSSSSIDLSHIHQLEVICMNPQSFRQVLACSNLVHLSIGIRADTVLMRLNSQIRLNEGDVFFPSLLTLDVWPLLPSSFWKFLQAPRLAMTRFHRLETGEQPPRTVHALPNLTRVEFESKRGEVGVLRLHSLLPACSKLQTIVCYAKRRDVFVAHVKDMGLEAVRRSSIREIILEPDGTQVLSSPPSADYSPSDAAIFIDVLSLFT
ncbi:hypothetical protein FRC18_005009 [Serendipita sp. 400]|nr:hypothetical protein FRC18_005009 [Serendipita sp. 400]